VADGYEVRSVDDFETLEGSGGAQWILARRGLELKAFGMNMVEIAAGGSIPAHDETGSGQVEIYAVLDGTGVFEIDGEEHPAPAGTWARFDPEVKRSILNHSGAPLTALLIGCPAETGYEPMEWA
jgi:quercetin dioxygenase-like cupin family protein